MKRVRFILSVTIVVVIAILLANNLDSYTFSPNKIDSIQVLAQNSKAKVTALLVGDSVALTLGYDLTLDQEPYNLTIIDKAQLGCGLAIGGLVQTQNIIYPASGYCSATAKVQWPQKYAQWVKRYNPNVVILMAGRWETANRTYKGKWTNITQNQFKKYITGQLELAFNIVTKYGASLLLETEPCSDSGYNSHGKPWSQDSSTRVQDYNNLLYNFAKKYPNQVYVQNLNALVCPGSHYSSTINGVRIRKLDGVHFATSHPYAVGDVLGPKILPYWEFVGHIGVIRQQLLVTTS